MAYEIQTQAPLYDRHGSGSDSEWLSDDAEADRDLLAVQMHTYQHDLESLFWLLLWIVLTRLGHQESIDSALNIFQETQDAVARGRTLMDGFAPDLQDSFHPDTHKIRDGLGAIRRQLYRAYKKRSPQKMQDIASYSRVCGQYINFFSGLNKSMNWADWAGLAIVPPANRPRAKEENFLEFMVDADSDSRGTHPRSIAQSESRKRKCDNEDTQDGLPSFNQTVPAQVAGASTRGGEAEDSAGPRRSKRAKAVPSYAGSASD